MNPSLIDQIGGSISPSELNLSAELQSVIAEWNCAYQPIIPLDMTERSDDEWRSTIHRLDTRGLYLAQMIADELADEAKVEYYSEGLLG
ncbi:hypothetical protein JWS13_24860 [Rhodococcus pseudokoreensis]|uniref:Uncharacterized protein n=2 Tax=Rhodococcus pseudokoreensis TaxID=2811421 RepID=A0A974W5J4_9NOCA|nr:hypothetical protein JWS13_24860 [Rhodococcus pseudokoreensis]